MEPFQYDLRGPAAKTLVLRTQPGRQATLTRPLQSDLQRPGCKTLDDGWPESVEEQSLLLLVWRHYITRQYIKDVL